MDQDIAKAKAQQVAGILETLKLIAPESCRYEPFYMPAMHAEFWLEEMLKSLPRVQQS